jgi:ribonuclease R
MMANVAPAQAAEEEIMQSIEEQVVARLKEAPAHLMSFRQLVRDLDLESDERHEIRQVLHAMVKGGTLIKLKGNRYALPEKTSVIVGKLSTHRDGYGFVVPEKFQNDQHGDVFIPARFMSDAMQGDTVLASIDRIKEGNRAEGKILKVLERRNLTIVGQFRRSAPYNVVVPYDAKIAHEIVIREGDDMNAPPDSIVNVEITHFPKGTRTLRGKVIEVLGFRGDFGIDVEIVIRKHQIPVDFAAAVLSQVKGFSQEVDEAAIGGRTDFRSLPIVTIDGETAKDFDDAVHIEKLENGNFVLGVHIADVSHYVARDTALDREALRRGTSVYFPDRAIPMLPEELSNGLCSLKPQVDRLTLSVLMEVDRSGNVCRYSLHDGVIRSQERMTYTSVGKILMDQDAQERQHYQGLVAHFEQMRELALILNERRRRLGSIDFDLPEPVIEFDEFGSMVAIIKSERNIAHRIIEEFMLTANETVARHLFLRKIPSLYRIHETPDPVKVLEFNEIALSFGYRLGTGHTEQGTRAVPRSRDRSSRERGQRRSRSELRELEAINLKVSPRDFQKLVDEISGKPEERILSYLMLRSLKQAAYSPQNKGHFGLASRCYTHFTSPIRRYPDLMVHRILRSHLRSLAAARHEAAPGIGNQNTTFSFEPSDLQSTEGTLKAERRRHHGKRSNADSEAVATSSPLYSQESLESIANQSSETERRSDEAERELIDLKKLEFMADKLGDEFEGIIIHITKEGMFVELLELFVEGFVKITSLDDDDYWFRDRPICLVGRRFGRSFRLGDRVKVAVDRVDRFRKRIDFSVVEKVASERDSRAEGE